MIRIVFLSIALIASTSFVEAQHVFKNDTLYLKKGGFLTKDQKIKLGKGSKTNGKFKHIEVNINNIMRDRTVDPLDFNAEDVHALSSNYSNKEGRIIRIIERGKRKNAKKYYAIIGVGDIKRYRVTIDQAIEVGEIIIDNKIKNMLAYSR